MPDQARTLAAILESEDCFLVASHAAPDGDAIGATAALGWILEGLGKHYALYNQDGLPFRFSWLPLPRAIASAPPEQTFARQIVLDCGDVTRLGPDMADFLVPGRCVNIDHHLGNPGFGEVNWVDTSRSSTGEMVADIALELGMKLEGPLGKAVYLSAATDTGFFTYGNTTSGTLRTCADIVEAGLDVGETNGLILNQWTPNRLALLAEAVKGLQLRHDEAIGIMSISMSMLKDTGTTHEDCENLIGFIRRLRSVKVAISVREEGPDRIKFSLRSTSVNVRDLATRFGGGGHKNASGGTIEAPIDEAREMLVAAAAEAVSG